MAIKESVLRQGQDELGMGLRTSGGCRRETSPWDGWPGDRRNDSDCMGNIGTPLKISLLIMQNSLYERTPFRRPQWKE